MSVTSGPLLEMFGPSVLGGRADPAMETEAGRKETRARIFNAQGDYTSERKKPSTVPVRDAKRLAFGTLLSEASSQASSDYQKASVPGFPPMYMHELFPQIVWSIFTQILICLILFQDAILEYDSGILAERAVTFGQVYLREADGLIVASNSIYERETLDATKTWFADIGVPTYAFAPLSLPKPQSHQLEGDEEVSRFLDSMKERFGPKSLLYVCFSLLNCGRQNNF